METAVQLWTLDKLSEKKALSFNSSVEFLKHDKTKAIS